MSEDVFDFDIGENATVPKSNPVSDANTATQETSNVIQTEIPTYDDIIPNIVGKDISEDYFEVVRRIRNQYRLLPILDYDKIYRELAELSVKSNPSPTLQVLNDEIQKVQSAKDRLSEILINVIKIYNFKKRAVDILIDSWGKFTSEKNAEGRKGDAAWRLSHFSIDFSLVEALLKACTHVLKNLDSIHDSLSRRITIIQITVKLQDIGRGALPDFDFGKSSSGLDELVSDRQEDDVRGAPKSEDF